LSSFVGAAVADTASHGTICKAEALRSHYPKVMGSMASNKITKRKAIAGALALGRQVKKFPSSKMLLDYDAEADVLYISLKRPQRATRTIDVDEKGILLRFRDYEMVGITVLDASRRNGE
jgi:uncharacterized protein YuzE